MIRTLLERMSRKRVLRRRLPSRLGGDTVFVSPDSSLRFWRWNLDSCGKDLFDFAEEFVKPGDVVWDIGANVGLFSFAAAFRAGSAGQVVAIEADMFLADLLNKSVASRSIDRAEVIVLSAAVSDSFGIATFQIAIRGLSANCLTSSNGSSQMGGVRQTVSVLTISLDWLAQQLPAPRVLKIDVEGAEAGVLKGAELLLAKTKPTILCEISETNTESCTRLLNAHGYTLYDFENRNAGAQARAAFSTLAVWEAA